MFSKIQIFVFQRSNISIGSSRKGSLVRWNPPPVCFINVKLLVVLFVLLSCRRLFGMFFKADKEGDDIGVSMLKM